MSDTCAHGRLMTEDCIACAWWSLAQDAERGYVIERGDGVSQAARQPNRVEDDDEGAG